MNTNLIKKNSIETCDCYICYEEINNPLLLEIQPCKCINMKLCNKCIIKHINKKGKFCTICNSKFVFSKKQKLFLNIKRRKKDKKRKKGHIKKRRKNSNTKKRRVHNLNSRQIPNSLRRFLRSNQIYNFNISRDDLQRI